MCKRSILTTLCATAFPVLMLTGCNDALQKDNDMLRGDNSRLAQELDDCRTQLQATGQGDPACQQELANLRSQNQSLSSQLNDCLNRPLPQAQQPAVPEGWTPVPGGAMIALEGDVLFGSGKAILRDDAKPVLQKLAKQISETYRDHDIVIYGHTDTDPIKKSGWKDNYELSAQRSLAVVRFLMTQGLTGTQLIAAGCGEHRPRGSNSTTPGRQQNRRVEIFALNTKALLPQR